MTNEEKRQKILTELVTDPNYKIICEKYTVGNKYYTEELFQEVCLILAEKKADELISKYELKGTKDGKPALKNYFTVIVKNQAASCTSPFYKKFKKWDKLSVDEDVYKYVQIDKQKANKLIEIFKKNEEFKKKVKRFLDEWEKEKPKFNLYHRTLFESYYFEKTDLLTGKIIEPLKYKQICKEYNLPYYSVYQSVKKVLEVVKNKFKDEIKEWNY